MLAELVMIQSERSRKSPLNGLNGDPSFYAEKGPVESGVVLGFEEARSVRRPTPSTEGTGYSVPSTQDSFLNVLHRRQLQGFLGQRFALRAAILFPPLSRQAT